MQESEEKQAVPAPGRDPLDRWFDRAILYACLGGPILILASNLPPVAGYYVAFLVGPYIWSLVKDMRR